MMHQLTEAYTSLDNSSLIQQVVFFGIKESFQQVLPNQKASKPTNIFSVH